ncbi:MAG TPA: lysophospholipid acyltransferase family protein [Gemmatimonadaceae bacterium]|nr:lysophospholipid acyltransferase family protein [Gemmatimonadaceae bacterium]
MYVPALPPSVPRRGNAFSRALGRTIMTLTGWKFEGTIPDEPKFVIIVAPHTSNWDFFVGLWAYFAIGFRISFLGKHSVFVGPAGWFMRWLGGIPVVRTVHSDRVKENVAAFNAAEKMIFVLAPEGTRKFVPEWKTGFYYVADGARVPIVPVVFDFGRHVIRIEAPFHTTGDRDADFVKLQNLYRGVKGKHPENFALS